MTDVPCNSALDPQVIQDLRDLGGPDDPGLFMDLVQIFLHETPSLIQRIEDSMGSGDTQALERAAHSLKSSAANLGAIGLSQLSKEIESAGHCSAMAQLPELVVRIRPEFERVSKALRQASAQVRSQ